MSAAVMELLARRWHCSVPDVRDRIVHRLKAAGVVPNVLVLSVTDDDRIAVLDANDHVVLWLDDRA
jgi:hypothetical protein